MIQFENSNITGVIGLVFPNRLYRWFIFIFIAIQPVFDALTFWVVFKLNFPSFIIYIRFLFVLILGLLALARNKFKPSYMLISLAYLVFVIGLFFLNGHQSMANRLSATIEGCKFFIMPITMLWIVWLAGDDTEGVVRSAWMGTAMSAVIIAIIVGLSLVTGTHYPTYDQPWLSIGLNGWFYSGNGQSVILLATMPFLLSILLIKPNAVLLPIGIAVAWLLLFLNGTRIAYFGLLIILAGFVAWMVFQKIIKKTNYRLWVYAAFAGALLLAVGLYPVSTVKHVANYKDSQLQYFIKKEASKPTPQPTTELQATASPDESEAAAETNSPAATETAVGTEAPAETETATETAAASEPPATPEPTEEPAKVAALTFSQKDANAKEKILSLFSDKMSRWSTKQKMDVRFKQTQFVELSMKNATIYRWLFGYGSKWFSDNVGDLETDYPALLGGYGIIGTILFFLPMLWLLVRSVVSIWKKYRENSLNMAAVIPGIVIIIMLGAAMYSGRAFQQPSVSVYLSLAIAMLYLISSKGLFSKVPGTMADVLTNLSDREDHGKL